MALKVTLFDHHFVSLPYIYLLYGIYNYILLFPVSLVIIIIIIIIILYLTTCHLGAESSFKRERETNYKY